jgi:hypothetical protein
MMVGTATKGGAMPLFGRSRRSAPAPDRTVAQRAFERGKRAYFDEEDYHRAAAEFRRAVDLAPDSVESQCLLGASLLKTGDNEGALPPLRRCLAIVPDHDVAHYLLGMALGRLDEFDEGERHLARAAYLGNAPARDMLSRLAIDYCRKCARAVHRSAPVEADVVIQSPPFGARCDGCGNVMCWACFIPPGAESAVGVADPPCPDCGRPMRPFEA